MASPSYEMSCYYSKELRQFAMVLIAYKKDFAVKARVFRNCIYNLRIQVIIVNYRNKTKQTMTFILKRK